MVGTAYCNSSPEKIILNRYILKVIESCNITIIYLSNDLTRSKLGVMTDSYMGIFVPADISSRILNFIDGKLEFPIVAKHELMASFYLFGKDVGISNAELSTVVDLAKRTVTQLVNEIKALAETSSRMNSESIRENYNRRVLQLHAEGRLQNFEMHKRISGDPTILSACFAQHVAYYNQKYFFELFPLLNEDQIPPDLQTRLLRRMVLLGYNVKREDTLPLGGSIGYFLKWFKKHSIRDQS